MAIPVYSSSLDAVTAYQLVWVGLPTSQLNASTGLPPFLLLELHVAGGGLHQGFSVELRVACTGSLDRGAVTL
jgi:hypothetical protein